MAQPLTHQGEADIFLVLVAIADDHMIGPLGQGEDRLELGFAPDLEAHTILFAEGQDLLDDMSLLVDFDRIDRRILALVLELSDSSPEPLGQGLDSSLQYIRESKEEGEGDSLRFEVHR